MMDCKMCNIPDVNCYEQCREDTEAETKAEKCNVCFGASFNDCERCAEIERMRELENVE